MINFLELVHKFKLVWPNEPRPECVPGSAFTQPKTCSLKCIDDAVISMSRTINSESQGGVRLQIILGVLEDLSLCLEWPF